MASHAFGLHVKKNSFLFRGPFWKRPAFNEGKKITSFFFFLGGHVCQMLLWCPDVQVRNWPPQKEVPVCIWIH